MWWSGLTDDQAFASGLHDGYGEVVETVDREDALHLRKQTSEQTEVAASEPDDCCKDLRRGLGQRQVNSSRHPVLAQQEFHIDNR